MLSYERFMKEIALKGWFYWDRRLLYSTLFLIFHCKIRRHLDYLGDAKVLKVYVLKFFELSLLEIFSLRDFLDLAGYSSEYLLLKLQLSLFILPKPVLFCFLQGFLMKIDEVKHISFSLLSLTAD